MYKQKKPRTPKAKPTPSRKMTLTQILRHFGDPETHPVVWEVPAKDLILGIRNLAYAKSESPVGIDENGTLIVLNLIEIIQACDEALTELAEEK